MIIHRRKHYSNIFLYYTFSLSNTSRTIGALVISIFLVSNLGYSRPLISFFKIYWYKWSIIWFCAAGQLLCKYLFSLAVNMLWKKSDCISTMAKFWDFRPKTFNSSSTLKATTDSFKSLNKSKFVELFLCCKMFQTEQNFFLQS